MAPPATTLLQIIRSHPILTGLLALSVVGGAIMGFVLLGDDWSATRRILGGAVAGAGVGLVIMASRLIE